MSDTKRDVSFDSAENQLRDVVLGFIHDKDNKRVGMRVWNRSTNTTHTHTIPKIDWQAWNLNVNEGRLEPKCCKLTEFPVLFASEAENPLVVGVKLSTKTSGAWVLDDLGAGKLRLISVDGQVKVVTEATAIGFHNTYKIANATVENGKLTGVFNKVLSAEGKSGTLYHGSHEDFDEFQLFKSEKFLDEGEGIYLTDEMKVAEAYGPIIYSVGLLPNVPVLDTTTETSVMKCLDDFGAEFKKVTGKLLSRYIKADSLKRIAQGVARGQLSSSKLGDEIADHLDSSEQFWKDFGDSAEEITEGLKTYWKTKLENSLLTVNSSMGKISICKNTANLKIINKQYLGGAAPLNPNSHAKKTEQKQTEPIELLKGLSFCTTSRSVAHSKPEEVEALITKNGGLCGHVLNQGIDYFITEYPNEDSAEMRKANLNETKVLSVVDFHNWLKTGVKPVTKPVNKVLSVDFTQAAPNKEVVVAKKQAKETLDKVMAEVLSKFTSKRFDPSEFEGEDGSHYSYRMVRLRSAKYADMSHRAATDDLCGTTEYWEEKIKEKYGLSSLDISGEVGDKGYYIITVGMGVPK